MQTLAQTVTAYPGHLREPLLRDVDRPEPGRCGQRLEQIVTPLKALGPDHTGALNTSFTYDPIFRTHLFRPGSANGLSKNQVYPR